MKKTILAAALLSSGVVSAGTMGGVVTQPSFIPYIAGEASWTSADVSNPTFTGVSASQTTQGWGGRLGLGVIHPLTDKLGFTGEIGGGYYGSVHNSISGPAGLVQTVNANIEGYDVLAGAIYGWTYFDIFGQVGFMVQNYKEHTMTNLAALSTDGSLAGQTNVKDSITQALPEIKVGGIYNLTPALGLSVAYMHVFGVDRSTTNSTVVTADTATYNVVDVRRNPTLDSVMFGLRYKMA